MLDAYDLSMSVIRDKNQHIRVLKRALLRVDELAIAADNAATPKERHKLLRKLLTVSKDAMSDMQHDAVHIVRKRRLHRLMLNRR